MSEKLTLKSKIILDLRNNPGGYLEISQDIAGWFLEKGQIVIIEDNGTEKNPKTMREIYGEKVVSFPPQAEFNSTDLIKT